MALIKMVSLNTIQSCIVGIIAIVNVARYLGKIEVTRANVMIADAIWLKKDTIMRLC